jgi:hypothetical protein
MRVLRGVVHVVDLQCVVNFISQKELFLVLKNSSFEQSREAFGGLHVVIDIESWWVCSHIKLSSIIRYVLIQVISQFDMAVNPL